MKPIPLQPNLPIPTTALGNPAPIAQYYICPHCHKQSPLVREWVNLSDEEIKEIIGPWGDTPIKGYTRKLFDAIEAKLKEKNAS